MKSAFHPQGESQCPWLPLKSDRRVLLYTINAKNITKIINVFLISYMKHKLIDFRCEKADYNP